MDGVWFKNCAPPVRFSEGEAALGALVWVDEQARLEFEENRPLRRPQPLYEEDERVDHRVATQVAEARETVEFYARMLGERTGEPFSTHLFHDSI